MLQETTLRSLHTLLPKGQVFTDRASLIAYEVDGGMDRGLPEGVVFPRTPEEMVQIVRWAAEHHIPLVARGAGTGLSGGAVADRGGVIVEFAHMNRILDVDTYGRSAIAQPAVINLSLDDRVKTMGLYFPPDPSSQRASTLGGNVAENSGGPHCFKYGVTTNYITGMDVVLANGRRVRLGGRALDYPEYDLSGLVTGSEGTLALIASVSVRLLRNPPEVRTLLAIFDSVEQASTAVSAIIAAGLVPATMEMMDKKIIGIIEPFAHAGLPLDAEAILIIDVDGYPESLAAQLEEIEQLLRLHKVRDLRVSSNEEERYKIWLGRKSAAGAITRLTPAYYTVDITVPRSRLKEILHEVNLICEHYDIRTGHLMHAGDGNLHPMLLIPDVEDQDLMRRIHQAGWEMVKCCVEMGGSLTGEHGVGIEKREYMPLMHNTAELMAMWDVKQAFDPQGILNPGKVFPSPTQAGTPFAGYDTSYRVNGHSDNGSTTLQESVTPSSAQEAAQALLTLSQAGQSVYIGDKLSVGQTGVVLSTSALRGIKTYAPDDMYITVGAGTPLEEVQSFLAQERKQVPLAPPRPNATIGGLVAANVNSPLRMRYGSLRDLVLYTTVALSDGRVIRTGRPLVKNVAGYDLTKVFIGSRGTLGLLTDVTLKLFVPPRAKRTLFVPIDDMRRGLLLSRQLLPLALVASSIVLCKSTRMGEMPHSPYLLAYTAEGMPEDVEAEIGQVRQVLQDARTSEPREGVVLSGMDLWIETLRSAVGKGLIVRVGVPAKDLPAYLQDQSEPLHQGNFVADIASGLVYAVRTLEDIEEASVWIDALRQPALALEGYALVMDAPDMFSGKLERWGYRPESLDLMKSLKAQWDPRGILNPGTFII